MSSPPHIVSQGDVVEGGVNCTNCGRFRPFSPCKSNANGNLGVPFATCHAKNEHGVPCHFIRRGPSLSSPTGSPAPSFNVPPLPALLAPAPIAGPSGSLPPSQFPTPMPGPSSLPLSTPSAARTCPVANCGQSRLADDCVHGTCHKHCISQGGCMSKTHKGSNPITASSSLLIPPIANPPSSSALPPSTVDPTLTVVNVSTTTNTASLNLVSTPTPTDLNPRYATHLHPIFTSVVAEQQQKSQNQRLQDAENKKLMSAIQRQVTVYAWTHPDQPARKICLQDFGWPFLTLDRDRLGSLGLLEAGERGDLQYYDAREEQDWMDVHIGTHRLVGERERILLRDRSVGSCLGLDECLAKLNKHATAMMLPQTPHLHRFLANECSFVQRSTQISGPWFPQSPLPPSSPTRPPSSPSPVVTPPSHRRQDSQLLNVISPQPPFIPPPPLFVPTDLSSSSSTMLRPSTLANIGTHWPGDFYVVDVAKCIRDTQTATRRQGQQGVTERVFLSHFPNVRFVPATFSNQKALWSNAPMKLRQRFEEYGRTKNGLWSAFARSARNNQKKAKGGPSVNIGSEVIEIDDDDD